MALLDTIKQAQGIGASSSDILGQISKQNTGTSISNSINQALTTGANPDDVLQEIIKQNSNKNVSMQSNGIIGSEKNFGQSLGDSLANSSLANKVMNKLTGNQVVTPNQQVAQASQNNSQDIQKLSDLVKQQQASGQDTTHTQSLLTRLISESSSASTPGANVNEIIPSVDKSAKQIIGEGAGVLTDLLTASVGLSPTVAGAAFGLTHALQQDKGLQGTAIDTAVGALGGKILEFGFGKVSPYLEKAVAAYGMPLLDKFTQYIPESALPKLQALADKASIGSGTGGTDALNKINDVVQKPFDLSSYVASKVGNAVKPEPQNIMNRVARLTPSDATKFEQLAGKSHGQYLVDTGNVKAPDLIVKNEAEKFVKSLNEVDTALASLPGNFKNGAVDDALTGLLEKAKNTSGANVKSPYLQEVLDLQAKAKSTGLDMSEINRVKRLYEKNVKLGYNKLINGDKVEQATNIDNAIREWQVKQAADLGFTNIADVNKQTQISKFLTDKLGKQLIGKTGNNDMSLTDWILLSGGEPSSIAGLITKKFFSSPSVQAKIAKMLAGKPTQEFVTAEVAGAKSSKLVQQLLPGKSVETALPKVSTNTKVKSTKLSTPKK